MSIGDNGMVSEEKYDELLDKLDSEIDFHRDILMKKLEAAENETRADQQTIIELTNMVKLFKSRAEKAEQELSIEVAVRKQAVADLKDIERELLARKSTLFPDSKIVSNIIAVLNRSKS